MCLTKKNVVYLMSIYNFLTCCTLNIQDTARLEELLGKNIKELLGKNIKSGEFRNFCTSLLSSHIGGPHSRLHISQNLPAQRQTLLELLVHLVSVLLSESPLLVPLRQIAFQPENVTVRHFLQSLTLFFVPPC